MRIILAVFLLSSCSSSEVKVNDFEVHKPAEIKELETDLKDQFKTVRKEEPVYKVPVVSEKQKDEEGSSHLKKKSSEEKINDDEVDLPKNPGVKLPSIKELSKDDQKSKKFWDLFDSQYIYIGEESVINATYLGVHAGDLTVKVMPKATVGEEDVYYFYARATSAKFYKWVYQIDDVVESFVTVKEFLPLKYALSQKESKKSIDHIELYDRKKLKTHFRYKRTKGEEVDYKKIDDEIPYFSQDFLSAFFFIRGMPLRKGDVYLIPTTTKSKTWAMRVEIVKKEKIRLTDHGYFKATKMKIMTKYEGDIAKEGSIIIWISDDKYRRILKFQSDFKIGAVTGELHSYSIRGKKIL